MVSEVWAINKITNITKRDILDYFENGIKDDTVQNNLIKYSYHGSMEESDFWGRVSRLDIIKIDNQSYDIPNKKDTNMKIDKGSELESLSDTIYNMNDDKFLNLLCQIFHPEVRYERGNWKLFLNKINQLVRKDDYELFSNSQISGRDIYNWRIYKGEEILYEPFSYVYKDVEGIESIDLNIKFRSTLNSVFNKYKKHNLKDEDKKSYYIKDCKDMTLDKFTEFHADLIHAISRRTRDYTLDDLVMNFNTLYIFDIIEMYSKEQIENCEYIESINILFSRYNLNFRISRTGTLNKTNESIYKLDENVAIKEKGLNDYLNQAEKYYKEGNYPIAVEKLWDAYERLKTYYPSLDKKGNTQKMSSDFSNNNDNIKELVYNEFGFLTKVGNNYTIRHTETNKIRISDDNHYKYLYKRCFSLISLILEDIE